MEWRWNVHPYYQHHNLGPPHHCHNKNSIMIFILVGLLIPWDTGEGFSEKITDSHTKMALTQRKKNRYIVMGPTGKILFIMYVCIHWAANTPSTKVGVTTDKKMVFWPKQPFPREFLHVRFWPPYSLSPKKASFRHTNIIDDENFHLWRRSIVQDALTEQSKGLLSNSLVLFLHPFFASKSFLHQTTIFSS